MDSVTILTCLSNCNHSVDNIRTAHEWFKRNTDIFKDVTLDTMNDILSTAKLTEKYPNEIIIRQGDPGDCFYVLLSGVASIFINSDTIANVKDEPSERSIILSQSKQDRNLRFGKNNKKNLTNSKFVNDTDRRMYGEFSGKYGEGSCFGELALIQSENTRNATILADEKCHLLSISRDLFDKAIRYNAESLFTEKISLVNNHFLFKNRTPKFKHQIAMSLVKLKIPFSQDISVQGQPTSGLILFRKGEAKLVVDVKQHHKQYLSYMAQSKSGTIQSQETPISARSIRVTNHDHLKREKIEVAIMGVNDILGDIEFGLNFPTNLFTVTALEMCEIFLLGTVHLERMFNFKRNISIYEIVQDLAELKLKTYYKRFCSLGDLPLFKFLLRETSVETEKPNEQLSKQRQKISLLPIFKTGPMIDFYGPGSVFFRNKLKRQATRSRNVHRTNNDSMPNSTRSTIYTADNDEYNLPELADTQREQKKSTFKIHQRKQAFSDWETSSIHLNDLENKIHSWMSDIEGCQRSQTQLTMDNLVQRLPRFRYNELPKEYRFVVKYRKQPNETTEDCEIRMSSRKEEDYDNGKKFPDGLVRQYTEIDYKKLKEEMKLKEKRLSIFRMKYSL